MFHTEIDITRWVIASGVLMLLLILFANALKFYKQKQPQTLIGMKKKRLKVLETLYIDSRNKISIIQLDNTEMVVAISPNGMEMLGSQEATDVIASSADTAQICTKDSLSGIGFLKAFVKGNCPTIKPTEKEAKNATSTKKNKQKAEPSQ